MKNKYVLYTTLALLFSGTSQAGNYLNGHGYIGLGAGSTDNNTHINALSSPSVCKVPGATCSADQTDKSFQVYGGYNVSPFMAVEGAYVDLGNTANITDGTLHGKQDTNGVSLSAVGKVPVGAASLYGKAGIFHWNTDARIGDGTSHHKADSSGTDPVIGLGMEYKMNQQWTARLGWDRYYNVGDKNDMLTDYGTGTLKTDVDVYTIGVHYNF
ncbi:MAG: outer membrane beta-barrel protein [Thiolinea sp.]